MGENQARVIIVHIRDSLTVSLHLLTIYQIIFRNELLKENRDPCSLKHGEEGIPFGKVKDDKDCCSEDLGLGRVRHQECRGSIPSIPSMQQAQSPWCGSAAPEPGDNNAW